MVAVWRMFVTGSNTCAIGGLYLEVLVALRMRAPCFLVNNFFRLLLMLSWMALVECVVDILRASWMVCLSCLSFVCPQRWRL